MKEFKIRKEINNEITKGYDEDTSKVESSSVVKFGKFLNGFPLQRETTFKININ